MTPTTTQLSTTTVTHPSIATQTTETILQMILANLEADTPAIIQISPSTKTATILMSTEIGLVAITSIFAALEAMQSAAAPPATQSSAVKLEG